MDASIYGLIYVIKNTVNGKVYVGQTTRALTVRWQWHVYESRRVNGTRPLLQAIRKYGPLAFEISQLEQCSTRDALNEAESRWVKTLGSNRAGIGYNATAGGESGYDITPEGRARRSLGASIASRAYYREHPERARKHAEVMRARALTPAGLAQLKEAGTHSWDKRILKRGDWVSEGELRARVQGLTVYDYSSLKQTWVGNFPELGLFKKIYGKTFQEIKIGVPRGSWVPESELRALIVGWQPVAPDCRFCSAGMTTIAYMTLRKAAVLDMRYPPVARIPRIYGKTFKEIRDGASDERWEGRRIL